MEQVDSSFKRNIILIFHFSFASLLIGLGSGLVVPYLNLYFSNRFDASNAYIGLILSLGSAMTAVAMLIGPATCEKGWESESTYSISNAIDSVSYY